METGLGEGQGQGVSGTSWHRSCKKEQKVKLHPDDVDESEVFFLRQQVKRFLDTSVPVSSRF